MSSIRSSDKRVERPTAALIEPVPLVQLALVDTPRVVAFIRNATAGSVGTSHTSESHSLAVKNNSSVGESSGSFADTSNRRFKASRELLQWMVSCPVVLDSSQFCNKIYEGSVSRVIESYQMVCRELWTQLSNCADADAERSVPTVPSEGPHVKPHKPTNQSPHLQCCFCKKSFTTASDLQQHTIRRHVHEGIPRQRTTLPNTGCTTKGGKKDKLLRNNGDGDDRALGEMKRELHNMQRTLHKYLATGSPSPNDLGRFTQFRCDGWKINPEIDLASKEAAVLRYTAESAAMYNYRDSHSELMSLLQKQGGLLEALEKRMHTKISKRRTSSARCKHQPSSSKSKSKSEKVQKRQASPPPHTPINPDSSKELTPSTPKGTSQECYPRIGAPPLFEAYNRSEVERLALAQRALRNARDLAGY
jgi:hypothetical protein